MDPYQLFESRLLGADAALLIVALVGPAKLKDFIRYGQDAQLQTLVEVHDEREVDAALEAGASIVGINNRNLQTLKVDPSTAERLASKIPKDRTMVIESGVREPSEMPCFGPWVLMPC